MNGTHVAIGSGFASMLADVFIWASHWPLQPLDTATATSMAGLIVAILGGGGVGIVQYYANGKTKTNGSGVVPPPSYAASKP